MSYKKPDRLKHSVKVCLSGILRKFKMSLFTECFIDSIMFSFNATNIQQYF